VKSVTQAIIDLKINFSAFKSIDDVADFICSGYGAHYTAINSAGLKRRGCGAFGFVTACACTGHCQTGIEASELDVLSNISYLMMRPHVLCALEELGAKVVKGKVEIEFPVSLLE
jgi:hypothetical protein